MKATLSLLAVLIFSLAPARGTITAPDEPAAKCPVRLERLDLRYNHAGGQSVPQLRLAFTNSTDKTITDILLLLSILDSQGNGHPYIEDLNYHREIAPGMQPHTHLWNLDAASVDIHHTGESITLQKVQFSDGTTWKDDGSLACILSVDFHPK
jgi:hypothetical protein